MEEESACAKRSTANARSLPAVFSSHFPQTVTPKSIASSTLRFPTPEGSHLLANWVTASASPDTMDSAAVPAFTPSDETSSLADSSYEIISSTDGESQDGRATDSVADSLDVYPRPDDVRSITAHDLASSDDVDDESVSDNDGTDHRQPPGSNSTPCNSRLYHDPAHRQSSQSDSIQYAENILGSPSTQSIPNLDYDSAGDGNGPTPLVQSIEFSETNVYLDKVSVKHTIRDFGESETADIAAAMGITDPPKRLAATIRQTMSHHCLSTRVPLKMLYVGSEAGYNEIMYKISSALLASAPHSRSGPASESHSSTPSIYNIIPISAFASSKVPEIDEIQLMGVSDYYIKVDRCLEAEETVYKGNAFPNDTVYSIKLDNDKKYVSVFSPSGSIVHPQWALPHIAVFYVSGNDDSQAEKTRNAAWEFMTRHAVPSIFISHAQSFSRPANSGRWRNFIDQAAVHLCLESRDPEHPIAPERLPIDLVSFLNIDARQMNRNLAYLTGLFEQEGDKKAENGQQEGYVAGATTAIRFLRGGNYSRNKMSRTIGDIGQQLGAGRLVTLAVATISTVMWLVVVLYIPFASYSAEAFRSTDASPTTPQALASSVTGTAAVPILSASPTTTTPVCSVPFLTPTVTISFTSTKLVNFHVAEPSRSTTNFGGFLTDRSYQQMAASAASQAEIKRPKCSIQVYSSHEILVKVPEGTKTKWLAKGAIDIDVWRGQKILKSRLSTTDEGIIIEINKKDAYGVMNVSIVTTRRPKINETFAVDFGKPTMMHLMEARARLWLDSVQALANAGWDAAAHAEDVAISFMERVAKQFPGASEAMHNTKAKASSFTDSLTDLWADLWGDSAADSLANGAKRAEKMAQDVADASKKLQASTTEFVDRMVKDTAAAVEHARERLPPMTLLRENVELPVLRAQIASKLWWMRVSGRMAESADYAAKAEEYLHAKERELAEEYAYQHHYAESARLVECEEGQPRLRLWFVWECKGVGGDQGPVAAHGTKPQGVGEQQD